ncbi:uncharacterized protein [Atheta coriaria]|uniref:uncharacterized protein n=1 Tax=Dalotia coriaria TaxID=877792 RepID=UPI0031F4664E
MEEDDNDELLQVSDDESMTESEETCHSLDKPHEEHSHTTFSYASHTTIEFFVVKVLLIVSSSILLILLPVYQQSMDIKGNAYTILLFNTSFSLLLILVALLLNQRFCPRINNIKYSKTPIKYRELLLGAVLLAASGFLIVYALDKKRVLCHLQDPMKGLLLVFSLIYYFFFCKKLMGLQRIFSSTTVIVGLFITVDYGLCNEFRCRGHERDKKSDDAGPWSWQTHSLWSALYILGLALFSAFYMLLDRCIVAASLHYNASLGSQFLSTISRLVSFQSNSNSSNELRQPLTPLSTGTAVGTGARSSKKEYSATHIALWLHFVLLVLVICGFWVELLPNIGTSTHLGHFLNQTSVGLACVFTLPEFGNASATNCGNTSVYAWVFLLSYVMFMLSSLRFLILCQSAVHTMATISVALPLSGIWWSLFKTINIEKGLLIWYPTISGELICALLGLPIITIGLGLLVKSHFCDWRTSREIDGDSTLRARYLA